jgi:hypothetical protein
VRDVDSIHRSKQQQLDDLTHKLNKSEQARREMELVQCPSSSICDTMQALQAFKAVPVLVCVLHVCMRACVRILFECGAHSAFRARMQAVRNLEN